MNFVLALASMCAETVKNKVCLINSVEIKDVFALETCLIIDEFILYQLCTGVLYPFYPSICCSCRT